jgi:hypothetical protein
LLWLEAASSEERYTRSEKFHLTFSPRSFRETSFESFPNLGCIRLAFVHRFVLSVGIRCRFKYGHSLAHFGDQWSKTALSAGHGPPLILLHGYAETSRMWKPIMPLLSERFTVIAPDLPASETRTFRWTA